MTPTIHQSIPGRGVVWGNILCIFYYIYTPQIYIYNIYRIVWFFTLLYIYIYRESNTTNIYIYIYKIRSESHVHEHIYSFFFSHSCTWFHIPYLYMFGIIHLALATFYMASSFRIYMACSLHMHLPGYGFPHPHDSFSYLIYVNTHIYIYVLHIYIVLVGKYFKSKQYWVH